MRFSEIRKHRMMTVVLSLAMTVGNVSTAGVLAGEESEAVYTQEAEEYSDQTPAVAEDSAVVDDAADEAADYAEAGSGSDGMGDGSESGQALADDGKDRAGSAEDGTVEIKAESDKASKADDRQADSGSSDESADKNADEGDTDAAASDSGDFEEAVESEEGFEAAGEASEESLKGSSESADISARNAAADRTVEGNSASGGYIVNGEYRVLTVDPVIPDYESEEATYVAEDSADEEASGADVAAEENVLGSGDDKTYSIVSPGAPIVPDEFATNNSFYMNYISNGNMNITNFMTVSYTKAMEYYGNKKGDVQTGDIGSTSRSIKRSSNGSQCRYTITYNLSNYLKDRLNAGELTAYAKANLYPDKHLSVKGHNGWTDSKWGLINMRLKLGGKEVSCTSNAENDGDPQEKKLSVSKKGGEAKVSLDFENTVCQCGSNKVNGMMVALSDKVRPSVKNVYVARKNGSRYDSENNGFKPGETGYIVVDYSEPIRFANNAWNDLELTISPVSVLEDQTADDKVSAYLTELSGSRMIFKFTVPQKIDSRTPNDYFSSVTCDWGKKTSDLMFVNEYGNTDYSVTKSKTGSVITDIAGNPIDEGSLWRFGSLGRIYMDGVSPEAKKIRLTSSIQTAEADSGSGNSSNTYAGPGDSITYTAYFSETLKGYDTGSVKAKLNIKDKDGNPVYLDARSFGTTSGKNVSGVDAGSDDVQYITFYPLWVTSDMDTDDNSEPITVTEITGLNGVTDLRGNKLDASSIKDMDVKFYPNRRIMLDTLPPEIEGGTLNGQASKKYSAYPIFTVPIRIKDVTKGGQTQCSGTINLKADLAISVPGMSKSGKIYYCVNSLKDIYDEGTDKIPATKWQSAALVDGRCDLGSFIQMGESNDSYFHIMLDKNTDYGYAFSASENAEFNCTFDIKAQDYAGNTVSRQVSVEKFSPVDKVSPVAELVGEKYALTGIGTGKIIATVKGTDNLGVRKFMYAWGNDSMQSAALDEDGMVSLESPSLSGSGKIGLSFGIGDYSSNEVVGNFDDFKYDFSVPKLEYTFDGGSESEPAVIPKLMVKPVDNTNITGGTYNGFVVIPADNNKVYVTKVPDSNSGVDIFQSSQTWYVAGGSPGGTIESSGSDTFSTAEIQGVLKGKDGPVNIYLYTAPVSGDHNKTQADVNFTQDTPKQELTAYLMGEGVAVPGLSFGKVYDVTKTDANGDIKEALVFTEGANELDHHQLNTFNGTYKHWDVASSFEPVGSIGDYVFEVNLIPNSHYEYNAVESFAYSLQRYYKQSDNSYSFRDVLSDVGLSSDAEQQLISISANVAQASGWYRIVLTAKMKDGITYKQPGNNFYVDTRDLLSDKVGDYPVISAKIDDYHRSVKITDENGKEYDHWISGYKNGDDLAAHTEEMAKYLRGEKVLKIGMMSQVPGVEEENYFTFDIEGAARLLEGIDNNIKYRIFSSRDESSAADLEKLWQPLPSISKYASYGYNSYESFRTDYNKPIHVTISSNISASDYDITQSGGETVEVNNLPLAEGANIIFIQLKDNVGRIYDMGAITVDASTHVPTMTMDSEKINGSRGLPVRQEVWPVFPESELLYDPVCYEYSNRINVITADHPLGFTSAGEKHGFIAFNSYGNMCMADFTADDDVDGEAPDFVKVVNHKSTGEYDQLYDYNHYYNSQEDYSNPLGYHIFVYSGGTGDDHLDASQFYMTFDAKYSKLLTGKEEPLTFNIPVGNPLGNGAYGEWEDYEHSVYGIYHTRAHGTTGKDVSLEIWGQFKYDDRKDDGADVEYTVSINAIDDWGNESPFDEAGTVVMSKKNYRPKVALGLLDTEYYSPYGCPRQPVMTEDTRLYVSAGVDEGYVGNEGTYYPDSYKKPLVVSEIRYNGYSVVERRGQFDGTDNYGNAVTYNLRSTPCYVTIPLEGLDKEYKFEVVDLFGQTYESTLDLEAIKQKGGFAVFMMDPPVDTLTKDSVTVTVSMNNIKEYSYYDPVKEEMVKLTDFPLEILSLKGYLEDGTEIDGEILGADKNQGSIVMTGNGTVTVETYWDIINKDYHEKDGQRFTQSVSVCNIDKVLMPLTLSYVNELTGKALFAEDENGELIRGERPTSSGERIVATVVCEEEIYPVDDRSSLQVTFPYNAKKGQTYTFDVKDSVGNTGSITATCPCDIEDYELLPLKVEYYYKDDTPVPAGVSANAVSLNRVVIAKVACAEPLYLIDENGDDVADGKTEFTYTYGSKKGAEHIFYVRDAAGNTGSITAVCPCDIVRQEKPGIEYLYSDGSAIGLGEDDVAEQPIMARIISMNGISESAEGSMSHIFAYETKKGDTATLYYVDIDGNECTLTAVCPNDIVDNRDFRSPEYSIKLIPIGHGDETTFDTLSGSVSADAVLSVAALKTYLMGADGKSPYRAKSFTLRVTGEDASAPVSIYIKKAGTAVSDVMSLNSDTIEGVSSTYDKKTSTLTLRVTKGAAFDLYLVDTAFNMTEIKGIEIPDACILSKAPSMNYIISDMLYDEIEKVRYTEVILLPDPDVPVAFDGTSVAAVAGGYKDDKGEVHENAYAVRYKDNGTYGLTYRDEAGNSGSLSCTISNIDKSAIVVKSVKWMGTSPTGTPADESDAVGNEISVVLTTTKNVAEAGLFVSGNSISDNEIVEVTAVGTMVTVRYRDNFDKPVEVRINSFTTGDTTTKTLPAVTCIDKTAPLIRGNLSSEESEDKSYITLKFKTDEPAIVREFVKKENGKPVYSKEHEIMITDKSFETITLSDEVGNVGNAINIKAHLDKIDKVPLNVEFSLKADHSDAVDKPSDFDTKPERDALLYVRPSKDAFISVGGDESEVGADSWRALTLPGTALVQISVRDANTGITKYYALATEVPDTIAPVMRLDKSTLVLYVGASDEDMKELAWSGVSASDDRDGEKEKKDITLTGLPDTVTAGVYALDYSVKDKAGNTGSATRVLYIIEKGGFMAYVDEEAAMPGSTVLLGRKKVPVKFENPSKGEVLVRITPGIKTIAQMKYVTGFRTENKETELNIKADGFSTVYFRNQDRQEICFYVFAED